MDVYEALKNNGLDWYVVRKTDGEYELKHESGLSSILQCDHKPEDYDIEDYQQCWNGEDLGEDAINL
jgi:hypothetical protein